MTKKKTYKMRLAPSFVLDHIGRDLGKGIEIEKQNSRGVWVEMTPAALKELVSDAEHYASESEYETKLRNSAKDVLKAIDKLDDVPARKKAAK